MGQVLLTNNAYTTLAVGCASGDATLTVTSSSSFPAPTTASTNWFYACIQDTLANLEIVKVTNVTGSIWTVTRDIGGTSARAFSAGAVVELRVTAETLNDVTTVNVTTGIQNSVPQTITGVTGTNTLAGTLPAPFTAYAAVQNFRFIAAGANTGAVTLNINGVGAKAITKSGSLPLTGAEIAAGQVVEVSYDGTQFQLVSGAGAGGGATGGGNDKRFYLNDNTATTASYSVPSGQNAMTVGPLVIGTGFTLTIPSGSRLVIL